MKKLISILTPLFLLITISAKAEVGIGITGAVHMIDGTGTETTRTSGQKNNGSHSKDVNVAEIFVEAIADNGVVLGLSYIPTRDMGSKSRSDSNGGGDTGTYKAEAELANVAQLYLDFPIAEAMSQSVYIKVGAQHVTLKTLESLNSGSTYPDADLLGYTVGLGMKGDLPYGNNLYYKADVTYTDFESYEADSDGSTGNKVVADLDDTAVKLSIGYKF